MDEVHICAGVFSWFGWEGHGQENSWAGGWEMRLAYNAGAAMAQSKIALLGTQHPACLLSTGCSYEKAEPK